MRHFLLALSISSFALGAHAAPSCPQDLLQLQKGAATLALIKSFQPLVLEQTKEDSCKPKAISHVALGAPLCLFAGELPAAALGFQALAADDHLTSALYLLDYTPESHARLLALLRKDYEEIAPADYPGRFAKMPVHEELTALFKSKGAYVALVKPSKGMPGSWASSVAFIDATHLAIATRDLNSCD